MKATEQNFPVVLFIMLYKAIKLLSSTFLWCCLLCCVRWFKLLSVWMKSLSATFQMNVNEQYFPVVLFIMLCKVVQTFECVDEILKCNHSNEC